MDWTIVFVLHLFRFFFVRRVDNRPVVAVPSCQQGDLTTYTFTSRFLPGIRGRFAETGAARALIYFSDGCVRPHGNRARLVRQCDCVKVRRGLNPPEYSHRWWPRLRVFSAALTSNANQNVLPRFMTCMPVPHGALHTAPHHTICRSPRWFKWFTSNPTCLSPGFEP